MQAKTMKEAISESVTRLSPCSPKKALDAYNTCRGLGEVTEIEE